MAECQFLPSISAPLNDLREKLNKHEVPGGETLKEDLVSPNGPLHFRLAINNFAPNLSVKGYFSEKNRTQKNPD